MNGSLPLSPMAGILVSLWALPGYAVAQGDGPDRILRLLALGDAPPFEVVEKDGARVELDPPEGSVPPRQVVQVTPGAEPGQPVRLLLNRVSTGIPVTGCSVALHAAGPAGPGTRPWHTVTLPNSTHSLALLWRDPEENAWTRAQSLTLADDRGSFPPGTVRIVNISPGPVQVTYGEEEFELESGKVELRGGKGVAIGQVGLEIKAENDRGRMVRVHSGSITQDAAERTNVIIYRADGERPRRPVKVYLRPENAGRSLAPVRPR